MIPAIAVIISTYAAARLLNEYVVNQPKSVQARGAIALIAIAVIAYYLWAVIDAAGRVPDL